MPDPNDYTCDGERWWGSNYGTNSRDAAGAVDIIAPTILPTTDIRGSGGYVSGNYYMWFNGTSAATPYAAGVAALILSANPTMTPAQIRQRLVTSATDVVNVESGSGWDRYSGYGMVNAAASIGGGGGPTQNYATLPYTTGFESGVLDEFWTTHSTGDGRLRVLSSNGPHAGAYHLALDDATSGGYSQNEAWLLLDLSGESQVDLTFWWKDFSDETHAQDGIYISDDDGASFVKVLDLNGSSYPNNTWQEFTLDIEQLAAWAGLSLTDTFVIKFQQYDNYPITTDGFAFDDISVTASDGPSVGYATLPYTTGFESGGLDEYWTTQSTGDGRVRVLSSNGPHGGAYHLALDDATSGGYSQNEAWLGLDLSGEDQVDLTFWWKDFSDETHAQDGIYISDDGGASFVKVLDLNGQNYANNTWQQFTLAIEQLAASAGLSLSDTFVIKFQQYDNYPIATDGFAFDDISVTAISGPSVGYATLPYTTGFESGVLDEYWTTTSTGDGRLRVLSSNGPHAGAYHLVLDDATSGGYSQNEAWLLLDLSGENQVDLTFWWKDFSDETHAQDGIYLSDDGGASFVKVLDLNGQSYSNNTWQEFTLAIEQLAASAGLSLSDTFVIKFQQYDNYPIATDGFAFDDISVF
jgi:hypothetical protein